MWSGTKLAKSVCLAWFQICSAGLSSRAYAGNHSTCRCRDTLGTDSLTNIPDRQGRSFSCTFTRITLTIHADERQCLASLQRSGHADGLLAFLPPVWHQLAAMSRSSAYNVRI